MLGNTFGRAFRLTACGESYGEALSAIVDGVPAGVALSEADIQPELDRRRPGTTPIDSPRQEADRVEVVAGVMEGFTTGAPVGLLIRNVDRHPVHVEQYRQKRDLARPGHAEYTYRVKYGRYADWRGAGRASGRETAARVAAGAVAKKCLARHDIRVAGFVRECAGVECPPVSWEQVLAGTEKNIIRCPDPAAAELMIRKTLEAKDSGDTVGGVVEVRVRGVPAGVGEPVFDKLSATLAHGMLSIPACKGFELGDGFRLARMKGSEANDLPYFDAQRTVRYRSNHGGGIDGGISNGDELVMRVCVKPTSTISIDQETIDMARLANAHLPSITRRDPTICARFVPVAEAMAALCVADGLLLYWGYERWCGAGGLGT